MHCSHCSESILVVGKRRSRKVENLTPVSAVLSLANKETLNRTRGPWQAVTRSARAQAMEFRDARCARAILSVWIQGTRKT
jgi:hypothetical protein